MKKRSVVVILLLSFIACGNQDTRESIRYLFWDINLHAAVHEMKAKFEEANPNIEVVVEIVPWAQYWQKLEAAAIGEDLPDVFHMNYPQTPRYYDAGLLYEWEGDYAPEIAHIIAHYTQGMRDAYLKNGTYVVFPKGYDSQAFAVNKKMFKDVGIPLPTSKTTYKEIHAIAKDMQPKLPKGHYALAMEQYDQAGYMYFIYNMGGYMISSDGMRDGLDLPETIAGVKEFKAIFDKPYTPSYDAVYETTAAQRYANNQIAMVFMPSWEVKTLSGEVLANTVILPLPKIHGNNKTVVHAVGDAIYAKSKHLEAAKKWVAFMNSEIGLQIQSQKSIFFPVRDEDAEIYVREFGIDMSPFYGKHIQGNNYPFPFTYEFGRFYTLMSDTMNAAMEDDSDVEAILKKASAEAKTFMQ